MPDSNLTRPILPQVIEQRNGEGHVTDQFIWGPAYVDELLTHDRDTDGDGSVDQRLYATHDRLYSVLSLVDEDGQAIEHYEYSPYGADPLDARKGFASITDADTTLPLSAEMSVGQYLYTGRRYDAVIGFNDHRRRPLSHNLGRWAQQDPHGVVIAPEMSTGGPNRVSFSQLRPITQYLDGPGLFVYAQANPCLHMDPSGLIVSELGAELFYRYVQNAFLRKLKSLAICAKGKRAIEYDESKVQVHQYAFQHEGKQYEGFVDVSLDLIWIGKVSDKSKKPPCSCWLVARHKEVRKVENDDGGAYYWEPAIDLHIGECRTSYYSKDQCMSARRRIKGR